MDMKAPCLDCPDGKFRCHAKCEKYIEAKKMHQEKLDKIKAERKANTEIFETIYKRR